MSRRRSWLALAGVVGVAVGVAALVVPSLETSAFPDAPDHFVEFDDGQVSFRHPPYWDVTIARDGALMRALDGSGARVILRRSARSGPRAMRRLERVHESLRRGRRESVTSYELDVSGQDEIEVGDQVFHLGGGRRERIETILLPNGGGGLVLFAVRGPVTEDPATDPRAITGSFRIDTS